MLGSTLSWVILGVCCSLYFAAFFLYHFMVFRVNRFLPPGDRIPHSLTFGQKDRLAAEYKSLYPRSIVYQLTLLCAFTLIVLAAVFAGLRIWAAAAGK
ncbi:MAG TPA: hypothetical protein VMP68_03710 [Candidatus Eisenbacteria bacterium]|nr:hypothetical protein [Candidatus Eisenbacteria bacterium]